MKLPAKRAKDGSPGSAASSRQPQSEEVLRIRARRRLIGAVALVLTGVVVFPLIFETQPKPVSSHISLDIPPPSQAALAAPASPASPPQGPTAPQAQPKPAPQAQPGTAAQEPSPAAARAQAPTPQQREAPARVETPAQQAPTRAQPAPPPRDVAAARRALAALEGKPTSQITAAQAERAVQAPQGSAADQAARYVVQAGAYADAQTARQVRRRIAAVGLHSYTEDVQTRAGERVRVRVGPFASRAQAEQALRRIQALGLRAVVLGL